MAATSASGTAAYQSSARWWPRKSADGREQRRAEDCERDDVEQRLGDERAEHDRQPLARPAEPPGDDQRARRLAETGRQGRAHQHADRRSLPGVPEARAQPGAAQDGLPRPRAQDHRQRTSARPPPAPRTGWSARARARRRAGRCGATAYAAAATPSAAALPTTSARRASRGPRGGSAAAPAAGPPARRRGRSGARRTGAARRVLVGRLDLRGDLRPRVAAGRLAGRARRRVAARAGS